MLTGAAVSLEAYRGSFSSMFPRVISRIHFFAAVGLRLSCLVGSHLHLLESASMGFHVSFSSGAVCFSNAGEGKDSGQSASHMECHIMYCHQGVTSHHLCIFYCLEASHRSFPHSREGHCAGCEQQNRGVMMRHL